MKGRKRQRNHGEYPTASATECSCSDGRSRRHRRFVWLSLVLTLILSSSSYGDAVKSPAILANDEATTTTPTTTTTTQKDATGTAVPPSLHRINSPAKPGSSHTGNAAPLPTKSKPIVQYPTPQDSTNQQQKEAKHSPEKKSNSDNQQATTPTATTMSRSKTTTALQNMEQEFFHWCVQVLGIETILEIQTFEYYDYMKVMPKEDWNDDKDQQDLEDCVEDLPLLPVRGLAASRDITAGEVVIRIPLGALLSVATTIDKDPVLTQVMGPNARQANGWTAEATDETSALLQVPLLAVALLYHRSLGSDSPMYPYIQMLQFTPGMEAMPFLWSASRLRQDASEGVRMVARGITRDMNDMYDAVVQVLIEKHGHIFGRHDAEEWMYSREKFQWAFAMITTRHWQLPIQDLHRHGGGGGGGTTTFRGETAQDGDAGLPPASTPTDHWVEEHAAAWDDDTSENNIRSRTKSASVPTGGDEVLVNHSFLAPFADLLNFGPPCTRGRYDSETHSFEITALCDFKKGQEVTFYYSDECDHVVVGAYGFMHPIVPPCPSAEEYRHRSEEWQNKAEKLEERLNAVYAALEEAELDLDRVDEFLRSCDCCYQEYVQASASMSGSRRIPNRTDDDDVYDDRPRHEHVRGAAHYTEKDREARHGSRSSKRRWRSRRSGSEF